MLDAGSWMLGAGCWMLGNGCWVLGARSWMLEVGGWKGMDYPMESLVFGFWSLVFIFHHNPNS